MEVLHVVGSRPNFMKLAPVLSALRQERGLSQAMIHTGQHYDSQMSAVFFDDLALPPPEQLLGVGSGSHAEQTGRIMIALDAALERLQPGLVMVYGDVNSTLAATLVSAKRGLPVAHVEAGLRSFDRTMPEEINRLVVDRLAALHFTPSEDADLNLLAEGVAPSGVHRVGNVMIDSLVRLLPRVDENEARRVAGMPPGPFVLATLHRPSNVDDPERLQGILDALEEIAKGVPVVFPVHPRTRAGLGAVDSRHSGLRVVEPLRYLHFLALERAAQLVITDSGGVQEETSWLGVPCLTVRSTTERPITLSHGTNQLVSADPDTLVASANASLSVTQTKRPQIPLWDGRAAQRIAQVVSNWIR